MLYTEQGGGSAVYREPFFIGASSANVPGQLSVRAGHTTISAVASAGDGNKLQVATALLCDAYQPPPTVHKYCNAEMALVDLHG